MKLLLLLSVLGLGLSLASADEFKVGSVIHPAVAKLPPPKMIEGFGQGHMAITTSSEEAARHFAQGLTMLNASWDFEAYRHFCAAAKLDEDCLMAYWGISLSLANGQVEFYDERKNAVNRMLDLLEAEKESGKDRWNAMETGYVQAAGLVLTNGVRSAGKSFEAIAKKYPANLQARLFSLYFLRDGFDESGKPMRGQQKANEGIHEMLKQYPENVSVMAFWVNSQSETPRQIAMLKKDVLPVARQLVGKYPNYAPFHLMLAHLEARCGQAARGIYAAGKAVEIYGQYMKAEKVSVYDCDGWVRAHLYLASLYQIKGDSKKALEVARKLAAVEVEEARVFSRGASLLLWEGRTIGARLVMSSNDPAKFKEGQEIMSIFKTNEAWFKGKSFAIQYRDCVGFYLGVRGAIAANARMDAKKLFDQFMLRVQAFGNQEALASKTSSYSSWLRALNSLTMMMPELRGMIAEMGTGATKFSASTWYRAATDRKESPGNLLPPMIDYPMELRLANHYFNQKNFERASEFYREGLAIRPNHLELLIGLEKTAVKLGNKELSASLKKQIAAVKK